ncbi:lysophospholipase [Ganoderma leucocontextum]|nr:lysophospholipase [Ganoderma leucocontextum]
MDPSLTSAMTSPIPDNVTETWLPSSDGTEVYTRIYAASNPHAVILFMHSFSGHCVHYEWMHGVYAAREITVFAFDQRSFGWTALDAEAKTGQTLYGKTSWPQQLADIEWWIKHVKDRHPNLPVFLMGHSMGSALALAFATRASAPPTKETVASLSGIVASSPFILRVTPTVRHVRFFGWLLSLVLPNYVVHTPINPSNLSHDSTKNEANARDPRIVHKGSLRCLNDMLSGGEQLLWKENKHWPQNLPLLIIHGTADRVTSYKGSEEFFYKIKADDKEFKPFQDGFHELAYEPDGVKEKFTDECISWILKHA